MASRILFVSHTAGCTGPTNSLLLLIRYLRREYDVGVLLPGSGSFSEALAQEGVPYYSFPVLDKWAIPHIARIVRREKYDLVYANNTHGSSRNAFLSARLADVPFVCHVRGMAWAAPMRRLGYLRFARAVIAVSEAAAASVRRFVRPDRLHVVYNGVQLAQDDAPPQANGFRKELGIPPEVNLLVSIAHLTPRKAQEYAVAAMREVVDAVPAHLCLVGEVDRDPTYVQHLRQSIAEAGLESSVTIAGFRPDVSRILASADALVHTALRDPHPRAVLEAMAAAKPVTAFAVDGVAETVLNGKTGFLVPPGDTRALAASLIKLSRDRSLAVSLGREGKRLVAARFSDVGTAARVGRILRPITATAS